jgi:LysR family cyn operon transcriptional activator
VDVIDTPPLRSDRLRAFLAVASEAGFSRAARRLGQTQSAVSQAIAALERELGEPLFVRDGRRISLTEAGAALRPRAERALAELADARAELSSRRALATGTLRLGTSDTLATYLLPPAFAAFRARFPGVELRLDNRPSPAVAARVAARELDLGVITLPLPPGLGLAGRPADDALRTWPLATQRDVLIAPPAHALAHRRRVDLRALEGQPLLLLDRSTATRAFLDARLAAARVRPRIVMEMNGVEVLKRLVELGFGLSIVPDVAAAREVAARTLVARPLASLPARRVAMITPTVGPLAHAARAFLSLARAALAPA